IALIDGEHVPDIVRDALAELPYDWVGAILVGGSEKLRGEPAYGVPLLTDFADAELVVDLSDEPVLGPEERFRWASRALAAGLPYLGADFRFDPLELEQFSLPSISVIGTGKRVGKTAVTAHLAGLLARDRDVVVVAMGRGGPPAAGYLTTYRQLISDVVIAVGVDFPGAIPAELRLRAMAPLEGRVAVFTAGSTDVAHLDADVVHVSASLADRPALRRELAATDADTYLVELKAAAIDVVAEH